MCEADVSFPDASLPLLCCPRKDLSVMTRSPARSWLACTSLLLVSTLSFACGPVLEPFELPPGSFTRDAGRDGGDESLALDASADAGTQAALAAMAGPADAGLMYLPAAFKGYELYAWNDVGTLRFTLIVGTNRQKTLDEIMGRSTTPGPGEYAPVHGNSAAERTRVLARVPMGTSVVYVTFPGLPALSAEQRMIVQRLVPSGFPAQ